MASAVPHILHGRNRIPIADEEIPLTMLNRGCRAEVLHTTQVGDHTLRTERELGTGNCFYFVDNLPVGVNTYLEVARRFAEFSTACRRGRPLRGTC
jgi:hypothetical protein